jgi:hypothetical protein
MNKYLIDLIKTFYKSELTKSNINYIYNDIKDLIFFQNHSKEELLNEIKNVLIEVIT